VGERTEDIVLSDFGLSLGKKSKRLVVKSKGKIIQEIPLFKLRQVVVQSRGVSISTDALQMCVESGVPLHFLSLNGSPYASISSPHLTGTVVTRRAQLAAFADKRGLILSKLFAWAKLRNQANLIKYMKKYPNKKPTTVHERLLQAARELEALAAQVTHIEASCIDNARQPILNLEGRGASAYWTAFQKALKDDAQFKVRQTRGARDLVNSLLNYGYGILYPQIWTAISLAGLDPFAGFLHVDRPGKPSLVLDLIEEFRQPIVDKSVVAGLNLGLDWKLDDDGLTLETRKDLAKRILSRLDSRVVYKGEKVKLSVVIGRQARSVATFLRRESEYKPYVSRW
jgi:CRISPR-associated protein Cas1